MKTLIAAVALLATAIAAPAIAATGTGDRLPHDLAVADQTGTLRSFDDVKGEKGTVLVFTRSADWCPYCQKQLLDLRDVQEEIEARGFTLVGISYDSVEKLAAFADKYDVDYTMLSDTDSAIIKAFGILNEDMKPGSRFYGIPHPAIYVVNERGVVWAVLKEDGYKKRPPASAILETIDGLPGQ